MAENTMLDLRNIHKSFFIGTPNEFEVLHGLNFTVNKGEFVSIVGQSKANWTEGLLTQMAMGTMDEATAYVGALNLTTFKHLTLSPI